MLHPSKILKYIMAAPVVAMVAGCAQGVSFNPLSQKSMTSAASASKPTGTCSTSTLNTFRLTKVMFLVDTSGSNIYPSDPTTETVCSDPASDSNCFPATDPNKTFRTGSIQTFFNLYKSKSNFQWGFVTFAGSSATPYISANGVASFDPNPADMQGAINQFGLETDGGATPYHAAITAATQAIANDPDRNAPSNPQYFVVLLTDGFPTDYMTAADGKADVSALISTAAHVSLSTVFYGPQNVPSTTSAITLLQTLAQMGNGQFANVHNPSSGISINDLLTNTGCTGP